MSGAMIGHSLDFDRQTFGPPKAGTEFVVFEEESEYLPGASANAGTPVFRSTEFVRIHFPGDNTKIVYERVTDEHRARYPREYAAFKKANGGDADLDGIPLKSWPPMTKALVATFNALNIWTVQHLASVSDGHIHRLGHGGDKWRARAKAYLAALEDTAEIDRSASKIADLEENNRILQGQLASLVQSLNSLNAQMESLKAAGGQGVGPAHIASLAGSHQAPAEGPSALDDDSGYAPPVPAKRKPGRPSNAELAARQQAPAA